MLNLGRHQRRGYVTAATPLQFLPRLTTTLNGPKIYMKRDDLISGAGGGNKLRKLDFIVQHALDQGSTALITVGGIQSNHCRETAAVAAKEGLDCHLVLEEHVKGTYKPDAAGNNLIYKLLGVKTITVLPAGESGVQLVAKQVAKNVEEEGGKPYFIPAGGSNRLGALGYVSCAQEILYQAYQQQLQIDHIVLPSGSAGTQSGILVGLHGSGTIIDVTGISVGSSSPEQEKVVFELCAETAQFVGTNTVPKASVVVKDEFVGPGYSIPTKEMVEAVNLLAQLEGIILDPVYSGKAFAGVIEMVKMGKFDANSNVVFLHTGGSPVLHVYSDVFHRSEGVTKVINKLH